MPSVVLYGLLGVGVVVIWFAGLSYLDLFTPDDVKAWRRLAALRGYPVPRSRLERVALGAPFLQRLQAELDLTRILGIANREETPLAFMARAVGLGFFMSALLLLLDFVCRVATGDWALGLGPWIALVVWVVAILVIFMDVKQKATRRQTEANRALGDALMLVAIMTDGRGVQLEDAVRILSRCVTTNALQNIVDQRGYQRLVRTPHKSTIELYAMIGEAYGIGMFTQLSEAAANTNVGFGEREMYTRLAKAVYQGRLAEARMQAARAKILVTIPVALMLIPLLVLLGAPTFTSLTSALR